MVFFVLMPLAVALGIGIGIIFPSIAQVGSGSTTPSTVADPGAGVRIEELKFGEELFEIVGQKALVYEYSGGDVEFWIELDIDGKKQELYRGMIHQSAGPNKFTPPAQNQVAEGYFVWLRGDNHLGKENWQVAFRRDLVTTKSSGNQVLACYSG